MISHSLIFQFGEKDLFCFDGVGVWVETFEEVWRIFEVIFVGEAIYTSSSSTDEHVDLLPSFKTLTCLIV